MENLQNIPPEEIPPDGNTKNKVTLGLQTGWTTLKRSRIQNNGAAIQDGHITDPLRKEDNKKIQTSVLA